jgi:hypothetical protein
MDCPEIIKLLELKSMISSICKDSELTASTESSTVLVSLVEKFKEACLSSILMELPFKHSTLVSQMALKLVALWHKRLIWQTMLASINGRWSTTMLKVRILLKP